jgi:hypothetical protein
MSGLPDAVDDVLAKLAKDVEAAVHAMYRGKVGAHTAKVRTGHLVTDARARIAQSLGAAPSPADPQQRFSAAVVASAKLGDGAGVEWSGEEAAAVTKCILAWLPIGSPASAKPDSRCTPPGRELIPTWGERELAREAVRKVAVSGQ